MARAPCRRRCSLPCILAALSIDPFAHAGSPSLALVFRPPPPGLRALPLYLLLDRRVQHAHTGAPALSPLLPMRAHPRAPRPTVLSATFSRFIAPLWTDSSRPRGLISPPARILSLFATARALRCSPFSLESCPDFVPPLPLKVSATALCFFPRTSSRARG